MISVRKVEGGNVISGTMYLTTFPQEAMKIEEKKKSFYMTNAGFYIKPSDRIKGLQRNYFGSLYGRSATEVKKKGIKGSKVRVVLFHKDGDKYSTIVEVEVLETKEETKRRQAFNQKYKMLAKNEDLEIAEEL